MQLLHLSTTAHKAATFHIHPGPPKTTYDDLQLPVTNYGYPYLPQFLS